MQKIGILLVLLFSCKSEAPKTAVFYDKTIQQDSTKVFPKDWFLYDIEQDTIPGISFNKAYDELLKDKKGKEVIIAVLDTEMDIESPVIKPHLWVNKDEIPNNGIDDDNNGYIDDINGWNFLGLSNGESLLYDSYDYIRVFRMDSSKMNKVYWKYLKKLAISSKSTKLNYILERIKEGKELKDNFNKMKVAILKEFKSSKIDTTRILKLKKLYPNDTILVKNLNFFYQVYQYPNMDINDFLGYYDRYDKTYQTSFNPDYYPRKNKKLGNNLLNKNIETYSHGTRIASTTLQINKDSLIKITPIAIAPKKGNRTDSDIADAIIYAVDNGAKVINMSFWKKTFTDFEVIKKAIIYAKDKDVLLVSIAGNNGHEIFTSYDTQSYPNDTNLGTITEFTDNLIKVSRSTYFLNEKLNNKYSNYSKTHVDLFAPGQNIQTLWPGGKYKNDSGTSLSAAIVSGMAANLFSYFPELTAAEVKQILMDSGVQYDILVDIPGEKEGETKQVPFSELSKSGKIANMYNAVLMAEEVVKNKKQIH